MHMQGGWLTARGLSQKVIILTRVGRGLDSRQQTADIKPAATRVYRVTIY